MRKRNKILHIIQDKSGSSFMFVLGTMLLLMAISVSALVAAGANRDILLGQQTHNQLMILDDSIHKNILYSLQHETESLDHLSAQLVMAIYEANDSALDPESVGRLGSMPMEMNIDSLDWTGFNVEPPRIMLDFPRQEVVITSPVAAVPETAQIPEIPVDDEEIIVPYDPGAPREPKTATVVATMVVTVEIVVNGKEMKSKAFYEYAGGMLSDEQAASEDPSADLTDENFVSTMAFLPNGYGEWRLIKHERVDS